MLMQRSSELSSSSAYIQRHMKTVHRAGSCVVDPTDCILTRHSIDSGASVFTNLYFRCCDGKFRNSLRSIYKGPSGLAEKCREAGRMWAMFGELRYVKDRATGTPVTSGTAHLAPPNRGHTDMVRSRTHFQILPLVVRQPRLCLGQRARSGEVHIKRAKEVPTGSREGLHLHPARADRCGFRERGKWVL